MVAIWANCTAWLVYAFLTHDPYVLASNVPGLLLGAFMTLSCYGHADDNVSNACAVPLPMLLPHCMRGVRPPPPHTLNLVWWLLSPFPPPLFTPPSKNVVTGCRGVSPHSYYPSPTFPPSLPLSFSLQTRLSMMRAVMAFCCLLMAAGAWLSFATLDAPARLRVWGSVTVLILLLFYAAPLSALAEVLRTRSAATLHAPLAGMSCFNGLLWSVYGAALGDAFIYAPNMVCAV